MTINSPLHLLIVLIISAITNTSCVYYMRETPLHSSISNTSSIHEFLTHQNKKNAEGEYVNPQIEIYEVNDRAVVKYGAALARIYYDRSHNNATSQKAVDTLLKSVALITASNSLLGISEDQLAYVALGASTVTGFQNIWNPTKNTRVYYQAYKRINRSLTDYSIANPTPCDQCLSPNGQALLLSINRQFDAVFTSINLQELPEDPTSAMLKAEKIVKNDPSKNCSGNCHSSNPSIADNEQVIAATERAESAAERAQKSAQEAKTAADRAENAITDAG